MADLLNTSISGLLAFQRALDTTSHNIANANTVGYSRQLPDFVTRQAQQTGSGWVGNGVDVNTIQRAYDDFLASQARTASSQYHQSNTYATQAERINNLLGSSSTGLSATLQEFVNALHSVADSPTSIPARQTLLSQAQTLVDRLQSYDDSLRSFEAQVNASVEREANTISTLARNLAALNQQISSAHSQSGQPPNDLLDQRDRLIDELATHVNVNVVMQEDYSANLFIGNGQPLVVGQTYASVAATPDPFDPTRRNISVLSAQGSVDITDSISGGTLGGMLEFRSRMLDPARNDLGVISVALAQVMNQQHATGVDLNGVSGGDFFGVGGAQVLSNDGNAGTGAATVTLGDAGALTGSDYLLVSTAGGWSLRRTDTGASVSMTGSGTADDPFLAEGLAIVVSGTPAVGDQLLIKPVAGAIAGLQVLVKDPAGIAAAAPITSAAAAGNAGNAVISAGEVLDASHPQLRDTVILEFTSATTYTLGSDPTVYTYISGEAIEVNGWRVSISGTPAAGDRFTVSDNASGSGDNRNALKLADLLSQPVMNGGRTSLIAGVGAFVGDIGVKTNQAQVTRDAQKVVADEAAASLQSVSGVNLDEEAANLIRYQQAYLAMSQMIRVADTLFQSVLQAVRG
ncbi:lagellar hook-associated protein 1 FlgK [Steroidobacter denitrificans]|uniref:Flagellar hook-associated protein 1 n=1 Tax=Steroidobacter denitrificans TaxID=465721 RepID=A0A127FAF6_STEDE|nr:flagellar hook-associated protein FlgK [Steroidobacter denitrificans]AMN46585.1 lagellar hook-associated protein 1 FlgK [Steroidobacter denitrificans]